jgi:hypothetical protein
MIMIEMIMDCHLFSSSQKRSEHIAPAPVILANLKKTAISMCGYIQGGKKQKN